MSDEAITVNLADLDQAVGDLQGFSALIKEQLAELNGHVNQLHVRWAGEAAAKHAEAHKEWERGAQLMAESIQGLQTMSAEAHRRYQETISANRARFT